MPNIIKHKRASATSWAAYNPVLAAGEIGIVLDAASTPTLMKIGDGVTAWNSLPSFYDTGSSSALNDLSDVAISSPANKQILEYDSSTQKWVNVTHDFATPSDIEEVYDELRTWGKNLVVNGYGELEDTTNFPGAILQPQLFDPLDASVSIFGFFRGSTGAQATYDCTEYIAVDSYIPYKWSIFMRGLNGAGGTNKAYMGFRCYTKGKSLINYYRVPHQALSAAEKLDGMRLTEDWNPNDDHIHIDSAAKWMYRSNKTQYLYSGSIRIKSFVEDGIDYGFEYMTHDYTNMWANTTTDPGDGSSWVDLTNNIVHLRSPRGGSIVFPAGTKLDCTFKPSGWGLWVVLRQTITDNDWVERNGIIEPGDLHYFHSGTYFIKPMIHCPALPSLPNSGVAVKNFEFRCIKSDQGDVRRTIEEERPDEDYLNANVRELTNSQAGIASQLLYLLNDSNSSNTGASIDFGFSTSANYYHASIRAIRTNEGSSNASKLSFLVRPAGAGTGDGYLVELFHLRYKNTTPIANLLAPLGIKVPSGGDPTEDIDVAGTGRFRGLAGTGIRILSVSATGVLTVDTVANLITYLGVALSGHDHNSDYLQLTGGTISGAMTFSSTIKASGLGSDIAGGLAVKVPVLNATNDIRTMSKADFITMVLDGHTHAYLPIAGGTVTGATTFSSDFALSALDAAGTGNFSDIVIMDSAGKFYKYNYETFCSLFATNGHAHSYLPLTGGGLSGSLGVGLGLESPSENLDVNGTIRTRGIAEGGTLPVFVDKNGKFFKKTVAQAISYMKLLTTSHDALFDVHGRIKHRYLSDLTQESDELGKLAWLENEKRMAYGLDYGGKEGVWQYLGITKVFPTKNDLMSEQPISEGVIACAITEQIAFVSYWTGSDYQWSPLVNEGELLRRSCRQWASLPSSPLDGHFQISRDKDVVSFYCITGGWRHLPVDSKQRIATPDDDYTIDPVLDKLILVDCRNSDVMITMPVIAQSMGREFIIRHHKGDNVVKITGQPNNTVDGLNSIMLTTAKDFVRLINDGDGDWCLVGGAYS